jgi:hypothetical protein
VEVVSQCGFGCRRMGCRAAGFPLALSLPLPLPLSAASILCLCVKALRPPYCVSIARQVLSRVLSVDVEWGGIRASAMEHMTRALAKLSVVSHLSRSLQRQPQGEPHRTAAQGTAAQGTAAQGMRVRGCWRGARGGWGYEGGGAVCQVCGCKCRLLAASIPPPPPPDLSGLSLFRLCVAILYLATTKLPPLCFLAPRGVVLPPAAGPVPWVRVRNGARAARQARRCRLALARLAATVLLFCRFAYCCCCGEDSYKGLLSFLFLLSNNL